ncbi:RNA polymerase sigma factor [Sphingobacterium suaedae]|uniref:RNA polymerase sigma factor n=1 Tax=Sphingobacterium suaedae TaxID=1686402 RepID=A0ABW5KD74_9SPHI
MPMVNIDEAFFQDMFYTYYDRIYAGFYKKTGTHEAAQDLTQMTFIKFWRYRDSYNPNLPLELQLFRKGKLVFIDWLRKESKERQLMENLKIYTTLPIDELNTDIKDTLYKAMAQLSPVRQKVFKLAYMEGFSHKEIAAQLHISVRTVETHILKAVRHLRKILALIFIIMHMQ